MNGESNEPQTHLGQSTILVEYESPALATCLEDSFFETRRLRHDGWDGPAMASFCRALAETGVVTDACRACGMSAKSAYALRQRQPLFARAWEAAISLAREKLADELLARSMKGSVEQIMNSDGAIVGERHGFDNKLAFASSAGSTAAPSSAPPSGRRPPGRCRTRPPPSPATGSCCLTR